MGNEKKIIEDLIGSLFDQNNVDENVIAEETNLILSYLNGTLDKKQIKEFQNRIKTDDDFRFRFQFPSPFPQNPQYPQNLKTNPWPLYRLYSKNPMSTRY